MVQAAQIGKQNIAEGSMVSGFSKETEINNIIFVNQPTASHIEGLVDKIFSLTMGKPFGIECILVINIHCIFSRTGIKLPLRIPSL